jgi:hypothetical protein
MPRSIKVAAQIKFRLDVRLAAVHTARAVSAWAGAISGVDEAAELDQAQEGRAHEVEASTDACEDRSRSLARAPMMCCGFAVSPWSNVGPSSSSEMASPGGS